MIDPKYDELAQVTPVTVQLNWLAAIMQSEMGEEAKLSAAMQITRLGQQIVKVGGIEGLKEIHSELDPDRQRTVEIQWRGLQAGDGRQWQ